MKTTVPGLSLAALALAPAAANAATDDRYDIDRATDGGLAVSVIGGLEYIESDFCQCDQEVIYLPVALGVSFGGLKVGLETGWLDVTTERPSGAAFALPNLRGRIAQFTPRPAPQATRTEAEGLADTVLSARYDTVPLANGIAFAAAAEVKFPTADEDEGLGSGETDYALSGEVSGAIGRFAPYLGVGYQWLGEPTGVDYEDPIFAYAGVDFEASPGLSLGLSYDYSEAIANGIDDFQQISAGVRYQLTDVARLSFEAGAGLSDSAPDFRAGVKISFRAL